MSLIALQVLVNARHTGYVDTQTKVNLKQGKEYSTYPILSLSARKPKVEHPDGEPVMLSDPGKGTLRIPAGSILDDMANR